MNTREIRHLIKKVEKFKDDQNEKELLAFQIRSVADATDTSIEIVDNLYLQNGKSLKLQHWSVSSYPVAFSILCLGAAVVRPDLTPLIFTLGGYFLLMSLVVVLPVLFLRNF